MQPTPTRWLSAMSFLLAFACSLSTLTLGTLRSQQPPHPARGLQLESIEWMTDDSEFLDRKRFKTSMTKEERAFDRTELIDSALARAKQVQKPVLVYVYKISEKSKKGRQMIRAPVLDIYMRQLIWSDPDIERMVTQSFVPVRTCLLYTSPSPRDRTRARMPSSA